MLLCLCQSVSSYGAVLTHVDVNLVFLVGFFQPNFFPKKVLSAGFFPGGYGLFPLNHCFVCPKLRRLLASCLIYLFLLLLLLTCVVIVVDVHCCMCAQQAILHLSEMQRVWVYFMVVHAREHVQEIVTLLNWDCKRYIHCTVRLPYRVSTCHKTNSYCN